MCKIKYPRSSRILKEERRNFQLIHFFLPSLEENDLKKMVANTALDMGEIMVKKAEKPPKSTDVSCWWKLNSEEWKFFLLSLQSIF